MPAATPRSERRSYRRTVGLSLLLSAALHAVGLLWPLDPHRQRVTSRGGVSTPVSSSPALRAYRLRPPDPPSVVRRPLTPSASSSPPRDLSAQPAADEGTAPDRSIGRPESSSLDPRLTDPRLWPVTTALALDSNSVEAERLVLATRIRASDAAYEADQRDAQGVTTWATGDARRWGLSPGRVHLGATTLRTCGGADPAGCGFGLLPNRVEAYLHHTSVLGQIALQAHRVDLRRSWRDRARAIRVRRDEARDAADADDRARADTISRR